jgi:PASTA domain
VPDTCCVTSYEQYEPEPPRGWSPLTVALIASLVLLLGLAGAIFGINAAKRTDSTTNLPQSFPSTTALSTPSPTPSASPSPTPGVFGLPNVVGLDFQAARKTLIDLKLGVSLIFEDTAEGDSTVRVTAPAPGTPVRRGITVKIYVKGPAPKATVPGVTGLPCSQAASLIVEHGLFPDYQTGRTGVVTQQSPESGDSELRWNDKVKIWCDATPSSPATG